MNTRNKVIIYLIIILGILNVLSHITTSQPIEYYIGSIVLIAVAIVCLVLAFMKKFILQIMYINTLSVFVVLFISNTGEIFLSNITSLMAILVLINIYQDWKVTLLGSFLSFFNLNYVMYFNESFPEVMTNLNSISPIFINFGMLVLTISLISQAVLSEKFRLKAEENEGKALHLAYHDALTGLLNRLKISLELQQNIQRAKDNPNFEFAMMILDLDNFKSVNDTLGHEAGDKLLMKVADILLSCTRSVDKVSRVVGRMGGDEFIILVPAHSSKSEPGPTAEELSKEIGERILNTMRTSLVIDGVDLVNTFKVTASIGISLSPQSGKDDVTMFRHADIAMYHAKKNGKNQYHIYSSDETQSMIQ
ncbi:diguanylate cyclase domain-containing protein [Bacillus pinisoli]|uniref:diguanylate cyclase domain-containing protein n=1 Tax=Bacillus pinisoli TaxID=2901866 RepID=UPI001FF5E01A